MAVDTRQQTHQLGGMSFDHMRYHGPHFTNPWVAATSATPSTQLYPTSLAPLAGGLDTQAQPPRQSAVSLSYGVPVSAPSLGSGTNVSEGIYAPVNSLDEDILSSSRPFSTGYATSSAGPSASSYPPTSAPQYTLDYVSPQSRTSPYAYGQDAARRSSHQSVPHDGLPARALRIDLDRISVSHAQSERDSYHDALDASRGMVAMSQDLTPRNIYGAQGSARTSLDSYGFPSAHSTHSSISSSNSYPSYYNDSAASSSVTDYSSASESVEGLSSRTLPRPSGLMGSGMPPAPQSMMGQFSSKVSSSSQKKHKCKICDKRFTRPSSLQTHMYSHTGEKRECSRPRFCR